MGYEVQGKSKLSVEELAAVKELVNVCNEHDGIDLKVNPDMLANRSGEQTEDFLCYEDGKLVGFLGLYVFHGEEAEVSGMVHPQYRRKGIFRAMQSRAAEECGKRKIPNQLFIVQRESLTGKACMEQLGSTYKFSEYWMDLEGQKNQLPVISIQMREAGAEDLETLIWLNVHGFQMEEDRAREMSERIESEPNRITYLIAAGGQDVGKISVLFSEGKGFIFGFCVHPDQQGKGYGRQALAHTIELIREKGFEQMSLEVACENSNALGLYESCGFVVKSANDYYTLKL
ncbi:GNAT family N-acetyltransferase [Brevibacillus choshinensis]|uniref:GNAT family N-acetyltransferase n=1 Tax=Brevibacillus choshinensis TaxID=54911 RepID=A0ABX7FTU8_BRECH|nr:GNAT family N-acetyltransferase [Brevibacillus choshinensis]QRG69506.1 GNAT family N-acetyltransferase [Brevibacillus choshinensis]